ncbi:DUF1800 domain-containing protein [Fulvitalea axinellae]
MHKPSSQADKATVSKLLARAVLGADLELIDSVTRKGYSNWVDEQLKRPVQISFQKTTEEIWDYFRNAYIKKWGRGKVVGNDQVQPYWFYWRMAWWHNIMNTDDQLRQRATLALSEIFVISEKSNLELSGPGLANYYDMLSKHAFGNYRDLLFDVTMHPMMGVYLSHMNNGKTDKAKNLHPDENYAREIMQLFSIGLYELNTDGTRKKDAKGNDIPTYDNNDIKEFAKIFTGFAPASYQYAWGGFEGYSVEWANEYNYLVPTINTTDPMQLMEQWHEPGKKHLLRNTAVPAGQTALQDINAAIDNLFHHPNVGPFIGKLLIQRLVTSNPSKGYVKRVAEAFNDNGKGERGDMGHVFRSILLDPEALSEKSLSDPTFGKVREPLLRATQALKAFKASNESGKFWFWGHRLEKTVEQSILASPTVFNFFLPDHQPNGPIADNDLVSPEMQIHNSATSIDYINLMYEWFYAHSPLMVTTVPSSRKIEAPETDNPVRLRKEDRVSFDFSTETALAKQPEALLDHLDILLAGGQLSDKTKKTIIQSLKPFKGDDNIVARTAAFMVMISPDYAIQK